MWHGCIGMSVATMMHAIPAPRVARSCGFPRPHQHLLFYRGRVLQCHMSCELCVLCQNAVLCVTGDLSRNACTPAAHSMHGTAIRTQRHASANGRGDGRGNSILIRHSSCFPGSATGARLLGSEVATKKPQWGEPGSKNARKKAKDSVDGGPLKVGEDDQV